MGVIRYDITEENFDIQNLPQNELSILTGVDSSSYLVAGSEQQGLAVRAFTHLPQEKWWEADERVIMTFKKIRVAWLGSRFTLVPARLYNGDARRSFLSGITTVSDEEAVLADPLPGLDAFLVYALDQQRLTDWRRAFVGCRFYHCLSPILDDMAKRTRRLGKAQLYAYIKEGSLFAVGIERNRLLFCNFFSCPTAKDYLYFILLAYEQCGWKPAQVPLRLYGEALPDAELYKLLYRYVKDVAFGSGPDQFRWGDRANQYASHLFYDLACLHQYH